MDAQPPRGCLHLLELVPRLIELFLGEPTILRLETLWSFLRPSIRGEGRKKKDHDQKRKLSRHLEGSFYCNGDSVTIRDDYVTTDQMTNVSRAPVTTSAM